MNLSYWEKNTWLSYIDFTIVGSGITGLNCALQLRKNYPKAKILVLERGILPNGASTKNAGFACFGSLSEILDDLETQSEEEVLQLIKKRQEGLSLLRKNLGDEQIGYKNWGGYELFLPQNRELFSECHSKMETVNKLLSADFPETVFTIKNNSFGFKNIEPKLFYNKYEGQINTGKMMKALLKKALSQDIQILNSITVQGFTDLNNSVEIQTNEFDFITNKLLIATNGFSQQLGIEEVKPARAQVLITKPIPDLPIKGTHHIDKGYYYFRNINKRLLFGGGRNLDIPGEETTLMEQTELIQNKLEELLKTVILPNTKFDIDHRWSGIMGVGKQKNPIVKQVGENVYCGVRLGGMGIAIGSLVGKELAELL